MSKLTPMMQQYMDIKENNQDSILFYRLGDFYEMFFDDAKEASKILELTLTGRDCGLDKRAPMCGVPYHSVNSYIQKLIENGYKVAICEQVEDPKQSKGIVKREIVRVITPGTVIESNLLDEKNNNYLLSIYNEDSMYGLAYVDISTGQFETTQIIYGNGVEKVIDEISRIVPKEILINKGSSKISEIRNHINNKIGSFITEISTDKDLVRAHKNVKETFGDVKILNPQFEYAMQASDFLLNYLKETQKTIISNITQIEYYTIEEYMVLDSSTRKNLELTMTIRTQSKKGSLLWVLDKTITSMGARLLKQQINQPLINIHDINNRLEGVSELYLGYILCMDIRNQLDGILDIERIISRLSLGSATLRDLTSLKVSLKKLPELKNLFSNTKSKNLQDIYKEIDLLEDVYELIDSSIIDDPPATTKDGGYIKNGFDAEIDELIKIKKEGKDYLKKIEIKEKERTNIKNLKIKYNKVFGYFLEVTKSYLDLVPKDYIRKQTLANSERYITEELKDLEEKILGADARLIDKELACLNKIKSFITDNLKRIKKTARAISYADLYSTLALDATENNYTKPNITATGIIDIKDGRHPVVEKMLKENEFVPNDTYLDLEDSRFSIITGPNMAGKSTYMRQTALIVLMAQIGCFVPSKEAEIGLVDRIFTRVGASDDLASGESTFMVEMNEVANILKNATNRSLLILDEIGRGTSTFDGLSIAWAVVEYISKKEHIGARSLFATHYHELTELEGILTGVKNYCIDVLDDNGKITFLRKIIKGGADDSYGIHVANLAGLPEIVTKRAKKIVEDLKKMDINKQKKRKAINNSIVGQINMFEYENKANTNSRDDKFLEELRNIEISKLTPMDALNKLYELQKKFLKG